MEGITITFYKNTDANGLYSFSLLTDGTWTISETIQPGWTRTPGTHLSYTIPLSAGSMTSINNDFFNYYIIPSTTTTSLSASAITLGQSVTDTATVTGAGPTPTGTVDFQVSTDGGATWTKFGATKTLSAGSATSDSYTPMAVGHYDFRAVYSGDSNYIGSTSTNPEPLDVGPADSTTSTELSASSITLGESVTDKATVTGLGGSFPMPTGDVEFYVLPPGGVWTLFDTETLDASGKATSIAYTPLSEGTYYFKAKYLGDANYKPSESGDTEEPLEVRPASWLSDTSDQRLPVTDFRIVFTPCVSSNGICYKISATNPGGFYYNILYHVGTDPTTIHYYLANDFATKGSMPVHAYIWNDLDHDGKIDYWAELTDVTNKITTAQEPGLTEGEIIVSGVPVCNNVLITIHVTFPLKGTNGYSFDEAKAFEGEVYTFSASDVFSTSATLTAHARVKKVNDPAIFGLILDQSENPVAGVTVKLYDSSGKLVGSIIIDEDGVYIFGRLKVGTYKLQIILPSGYTTSQLLTVQKTLQKGNLIQVNFNVIKSS